MNQFVAFVCSFLCAAAGSTELYASYLQSVYGRDGHKVNNGISFGVTWNFSPAQLVRRAFPPTGARARAETP